MGDRRYTVYIMASRRNGTLYVGVTNDLARRAFQHRNGVGSQFTAKYQVKMLVWYEHYSDINEAIAREKQLKKWEPVEARIDRELQSELGRPVRDA
jgi:putative endonuclease